MRPNHFLCDSITHIIFDIVVLVQWKIIKMTNYYRNVEHGDINLYSYMVRKDIQTNLALGGIPNRLHYLRLGNLPIILDWIESREGLPTYFHCFTMISLYCQRLLYHCTFKEMKKLIEVICEQIELLESNKFIP